MRTLYLWVTRLIVLSVLSPAFGTVSFATEVDGYNTYQWKKRNIGNKDWFEWWYYKVVLPETDQAYFFVYGVVNPGDVNHIKESTRAYVGMGDFENKVTFESIHPMESFKASELKTLVEVPGARATDKNISGHVTNEAGREYIWDINIEKNWSINAEGWMLGTGLSNIDWYPAQADATCTGQIIVDNKLVQFNEAPCYQDRNWGESFPEWWTWIVSNHFKNYPETALIVGGGLPKILDNAPPRASVTIGLKHKGRDYRFSPFNFDKIDLNISFGIWKITAVNFKQTNKIVIDAFAPKEKFMDLQFTMPNGQVFHDYEALLGDLEVKLYTRENLLASWQLVDRLISNYAGIEYGSKDIQSFEALFKKQGSLYSNEP